MMWYYYLNYKIYSLYRRKRETIPAFFSFAATVTLAQVNCMSLEILFSFFFPSFMIKDIKPYALSLLAILTILNYLILYRKKYFEDVFEHFDKHESKYKKWNMSVQLYIILSVAMLFLSVVLIDLRNHGKL